MLLWAMAPAREPARSRSWILSISWSVPMNRLICKSQNRQTLRLHDLPQPPFSFQLVLLQSPLSVPSPAHRPWTWWLTRVQSSAHWCHSLATVTLGHPPGSSEWTRQWCTCCYCERHEPGGERQAWISSSPNYDSATFFSNPGTKGRFFIYPEICQGFNPFQITSTIGKQASFLFCQVYH